MAEEDKDIWDLEVIKEEFRKELSKANVREEIQREVRRKSKIDGRPIPMWK